MSEEEIEAIEELKEEISKPVEILEDKFNTFILYNIEKARIILNLIDKLQKENERLRYIRNTNNNIIENTYLINKSIMPIEKNKFMIEMENGNFVNINYIYELQNRINKAIEYIEENSFEDSTSAVLNLSDEKYWKLIKILKGESDE